MVQTQTIPYAYCLIDYIVCTVTNSLCTLFKNIEDRYGTDFGAFWDQIDIRVNIFLLLSHHLLINTFALQGFRWLHHLS